MLVAHPSDETRFTCEDARHLPSPLLLVQGEKTGRDFREIVARIAACAPAARTVVLPGSRHVVQIDAPEALARVVVELLSN